MKAKSYTGISRPLGEYNKRLLEIIEGNLNFFNTKKRKGILTVKHYVENGDKWRICKDNKNLVCGMTLEELYYAVASTISYETR